MNSHIASSPTAALDMRHDCLAERQQALIAQLDQAELQWWQQALARRGQSPDANTAAPLRSQCKRRIDDRALLDDERWS
ncbi:hypothetical protein GE454_26630, partial [Pseudomonas soli]|nr:hypothetical protein [Pseudomonas soli]